MIVWERQDLIHYMYHHPIKLSIVCVIILLIGIALKDIFQKKHTILHNFPIIGHFRYFLENIGPELRQYLVANDKEEMPFNRHERSWIYATAKGQKNTIGFGTTELLYGTGYPILKHRGFPFPDEKALTIKGNPTAIPCLKLIGQSHKRKRPYRPRSIINISAMSFGSLGKHAISALNKGAKIADCFHNTGEGSVSPYHKSGSDLTWQLGTGYFGARKKNGRFDLDQLIKKTQENPSIRLIEIKLSQGAKPGKGGILPGKKVTKEISEIRGIPVGKTCYSPNYHREFSTIDEMITFIETIASASGIPVGIKSAIGDLEFWIELAKRMKKRKEGPDFISIDGGEGGTGAAPLTFADHVSLPFKLGFTRVYTEFQKQGISKNIAWIGSGKLGFPDRAIVGIAMGCDLINIAREAMLSIGCIQALKCHTDHCPAGVATHNKWLQKGLNITDKSQRAAQFIQGFRKELLTLSYAAGYEHPSLFTGKDVEFSTGVNKFSTLEDVLGYKKDVIPYKGMQTLTSKDH